MFDARTIASKLGGKVVNGRALVPGPGHSAHDRSLSIKPDASAPEGFICHSFSGDDFAQCRDYAKARLGLPSVHDGNKTAKPQQNIVANYCYEDERGDSLFEVVRFNPKDFRQRRPDGHGGWIWNLDGVRRIPYRLPELIEAVANGYVIALVEGEKDVDALSKIGIHATTFPGGAGKWRQEYAAHFRGADVVIIPDKDDVGRAHARQVAAGLAGTATRIRVLDIGKTWPQCPAKGDVSDWLAADGTRERLDELIDGATDVDQRILDTVANGHPDKARSRHVRDARGAEPGLEVLCLADVQARPIEWLWKNWLAIGKVSILAGEGGKGKSTILCDLAARTTRGMPWPDNAEASPPGDVFIMAAEDDIEDTRYPRSKRYSTSNSLSSSKRLSIVWDSGFPHPRYTLAPRLLAAGADMSRVFNIRAVRNDDLSRRWFNLQADLERLEAEIKSRENVRLVIIDPVSSYLGKGVDSHKNADVRSVLEPIGDMAARTRTAILCNNHFSKVGGSANNRMIGSVAFINYARAGFIVTPDAENEGRLLLMPSKMNIAPIKYGLAYRIESALLSVDGTDVLTSRIAWESQPVKMSADEALAAHDRSSENKTGKAEAMEYLRDALSGRARPANEVKQDATAAGITPKSLRTAREALGVRLTKAGMSGGWVWELPKVPLTPEDAHHGSWAPSASKGTFGDIGAPGVPPNQ
jgi:putative DNA primase/helicase